ncbi:hypothetical protein RhiirA1_472968 [Rhizophagus irregularis]|uniref:Uncharacterized protein n=1 Tax=Rhizophagus irregularis TaxID=588596 RepID=A0A2N0R1F4_9GLOM|nr:hypothetical protein RhiirA1_472968 [Rhizophagus irregularis]
MSRKRSVSSILNDLDDEESPSNQPSSTLVCNCSNCNDNLVDSRTKEIHNSKHQEYQDLQSTILSQVRQLEIEDLKDSSSSEYTTEEDIYRDTLSIGSKSDNDPISGISGIFEDYLPPKTATETLIKFMKLVLCEFSSDDFNDFPDSQPIVA